jgi:hypothetical protein
MTITDLSGYAHLVRSAGADPDVVFDEMLWVIREATRNNPRSLQREIGPSELGHPCTRWLGYKLAEAPKVNDAVSWRATIGVATHEWLARVFTDANDLLPDGDPVRWLAENRVHVGEIAGPDGYDVHGSCDVYDLCCAWKIVAQTTLDNARRHGPEHKYKVQGHAYGRGWRRRGLPVANVAVAFLPASGELEDAVFWHEPYDEQVVLDALARVDAVAGLVSQVGVAAARVLPTAEHYCTRCPYYRPNSQDVTAACPGDPGIRRQSPDPINQLIA